MYTRSPMGVAPGSAICCNIFFAAFVRYIIKHLFMNIYVLLHFKHKNDSRIQKFDNDCDVIFMFKM